MNREELLARCKTVKEITEDQFQILAQAYILLDYPKDAFCKLVDAIGLDAWVGKKLRWEHLAEAYQEWEWKADYERKKARLEEITNEQECLRAAVEHYENQHRFD